MSEFPEELLAHPLETPQDLESFHEAVCDLARWARSHPLKLRPELALKLDQLNAIVAWVATETKMERQRRVP